MASRVQVSTMCRAPRATSYSSWDFKDSFTARACGLLASEFILLGFDGEELARLRLRGSSRAEYVPDEDYAATFEVSGRRYRMVVEGEEMLVAEPKERSIDEFEISCDDRTYEARISFFRNLAVASRPDGERAVRLSGGLTGRSYEALLAAEDSCALPVAVFLLWHIVANRRRTYLTGGGAM